MKKIISGIFFLSLFGNCFTMQPVVNVNQSDRDLRSLSLMEQLENLTTPRTVCVEGKWKIVRDLDRNKIRMAVKDSGLSKYDRELLERLMSAENGTQLLDVCDDFIKKHCIFIGDSKNIPWTNSYCKLYGVPNGPKSIPGKTCTVYDAVMQGLEDNDLMIVNAVRDLIVSYYYRLSNFHQQSSITIYFSQGDEPSRVYPPQYYPRGTTKDGKFGDWLIGININISDWDKYVAPRYRFGFINRQIGHLKHLFLGVEFNFSECEDALLQEILPYHNLKDYMVDGYGLLQTLGLCSLEDNSYLHEPNSDWANALERRAPAVFLQVYRLNGYVKIGRDGEFFVNNSIFLQPNSLDVLNTLSGTNLNGLSFVESTVGNILYTMSNVRFMIGDIDYINELSKDNPLFNQHFADLRSDELIMMLINANTRYYRGVTLFNSAKLSNYQNYLGAVSPFYFAEVAPYAKDRYTPLFANTSQSAEAIRQTLRKIPEFVDIRQKVEAGELAIDRGIELLLHAMENVSQAVPVKLGFVFKMLYKQFDVRVDVLLLSMLEQFRSSLEHSLNDNKQFKQEFAAISIKDLLGSLCAFQQIGDNYELLMYLKRQCQIGSMQYDLFPQISGDTLCTYKGVLREAIDKLGEASDFVQICNKVKAKQLTVMQALQILSSDMNFASSITELSIIKNVLTIQFRERVNILSSL